LLLFNNSYNKKFYIVEIFKNSYMTKKLIDRIKEKPIRVILQGAVGLVFIDEAIETALSAAERVNRFQPQIEEIFGQVGYVAGQIVTPLAFGASTVVLGYAAIVGAGMFLDEYYYKDSKMRKLK